MTHTIAIDASPYSIELIDNGSDLYTWRILDWDDEVVDDNEGDDAQDWDAAMRDARRAVREYELERETIHAFGMEE